MYVGDSNQRSECSGLSSAIRLPFMCWMKHATTFFRFTTQCCGDSSRHTISSRTGLHFQNWIGTLMLGLVFWLALSPLAFRGLKWLRVLNVPAALVVGILNGSAHILSSIYLGRWMPGVYCSPLLLLSGTLLLREALGGKGKTLA